PYNAPPALLRQAVELGFLLIPSLPVVPGDRQPIPQSVVGQEVSRFSETNNVLFWDLGNSLVSEQAVNVTKAVQMVREAVPGRPIEGDIWDGFLAYSRSLNLIGVHRWPLMTGLELSAYQRWLNQRRLLASPGTYLWTWIQTQTPEFFTQLLYNQSSTKS